MTEHEMTDALVEHLYGIDDRLDERVVSYRTFAEAGLLTRNAGLVIRLDDGSEYQITVVKNA